MEEILQKNNTRKLQYEDDTGGIYIYIHSYIRWCKISSIHTITQQLLYDGDEGFRFGYCLWSIGFGFGLKACSRDPENPRTLHGWRVIDGDCGLDKI